MVHIALQPAEKSSLAGKHMQQLEFVLSSQKPWYGLV